MGEEKAPEGQPPAAAKPSGGPNWLMFGVIWVAIVLVRDNFLSGLKP